MVTTSILDLPEMRARVYQWSVPDYLALTQDDPAFHRCELIRGIIVGKMSKGPLHEFLTNHVCERLRREVVAGLAVRQEASLRLADSVPEPDAAVVRGTWREFQVRQPTTAELVVEVAVSSVVLDRKNASLYAEAGVAEYWIILAEAEQIEAYRHPVNGAYQERRIYRRGEMIPCACVEGGTVPVDTWFA